METTLDLFERRVLGVLIEKSIAQPSYYPMTSNAVVAACNQKNNRDPVMELDEETVFRTLTALRQKGIVRQVLPGGGARTDRFRHEAFEHFGWEPRERAIMCELLLRGPQTPGELRTRCSRLMPFETLDSVSIVLDNLSKRETAFVRLLPRRPREAADRYDHTMYPADEERPADQAPAAAPAGAERSATAAHAGVSHAALHTAASHAGAPHHSAARDSDETKLEVQALRETVDELSRTIDDLTSRLERLEGLMT
jgi:uncharacterized protein YceH (UPF0502 family)